MTLTDVLPASLPGKTSLSTLTFVHVAPEAFSHLLQLGFSVLIPGECTVREFLCDTFHIPAPYAEKRIQTVFLDGLAVSDRGKAIVRAGSRLALSTALPGLVGAMMRGEKRKVEAEQSDASLDDRPVRKDQPCLVRVRLFNFISTELAGCFLSRGIFLSTSTFLEYWEKKQDCLTDGSCSATLDCQPLSTRSDGQAWAAAGMFLFLRLAQPGAPVLSSGQHRLQTEIGA